MMKRYFPDNLSPADRRTYKLWTRKFYLIYFVTVAVALALGVSGKSKGDRLASASPSTQGNSSSINGDRGPVTK